MLYRKFKILGFGLLSPGCFYLVVSALITGETRIGYSRYSSFDAKFEDYPMPFIFMLLVFGFGVFYGWKATIAEYRFTRKHRIEIEEEENREPSRRPR